MAASEERSKRDYRQAWAAQNYRARRMGIEGTITGDDWAELVKKQGGKCPYCDGGRYLVIDHIIPLSRGGTNTKDNIQAICVQCNSSKGNKLPEEWPGRKLPPGDY